LSSRIFATAALCVLLGAAGFAQQPGAASEPNPETSKPIESGQPHLSKQQARAALESPEFTPQTAQAILERLADGMQSHNLRQAASVFDRDSFDAAFFEQMAVAFRQFESFHVYYHLGNAEPQDGKAELSVDFRLEALPREGELRPRRQDSTLKIQLSAIPQRSGHKQWQVTGLDPADFLFQF
jgi:hypothetical protein